MAASNYISQEFLTYDSKQVGIAEHKTCILQNGYCSFLKPAAANLNHCELDLQLRFILLVGRWNDVVCTDTYFDQERNRSNQITLITLLSAWCVNGNTNFLPVRIHCELLKFVCLIYSILKGQERSGLIVFYLFFLFDFMLQCN